MEMHQDVIVIGGSFAGLAAATYLARSLRTVRVIDAGAPRNRFAEASHGFLGQDGEPPSRILERARAQVVRYPTVTLQTGTVHAASAVPGGFQVTLEGEEPRTARMLVLAMGVRDVLPDLPGLASRWGRSVLHCPYCHGFEHARRPLGVLHSGPMSLHQASLVAEWGPLTLYMNGAGDLPEEELAPLRARGIEIEPRAIAALEGEGPELSSVRFADGDARPLEALFIAPELRLNGEAVIRGLGCALDETPMGPLIRTDANKRTTVPGVFAAGDLARQPHSVSWAVGDGVMAGVAAHRALVFGIEAG